MENDLDDLIADYISHTLSEEKRQEFERRLAADADLARRVTLEGQLFEALSSGSPEMALRRNLVRIAEKFDSSETTLQDAAPARSDRKWYWWLLGLALLAVSALLFRIIGQGSESLPAQKVEQAPGIQRDTEIPERATPPAEPHPDHKPVKSAPMAAAFEELPKLESYIGSRLRGGEYHFNITAPQRDRPLQVKQEKTVFYLKGTLEGQAPENASFKVLIFSNSRQRFEAMQPLTSYVLNIDSEGRFNLGAILPLTPGLYYYLLEEQDTGAWVHVDKFLVK